MSQAAPIAIRIPPLRQEGVQGIPLFDAVEPSRLVVVRLQAFGDAAAVLPVLSGLKVRWPSCRLEVVTDVRSAPLFEARTDVERVHAFDARANRFRAHLEVWRLARKLRREPVDAVVDLQRSRLSRALVYHIGPKAWVGFDRFAPRTGMTRYLEAVEWVGLGPVQPVFASRLAPGISAQAESLLAEAGRDPARPLVCLNPAGGWETKQWPLPRWAELGHRLEKELGAQLLAIGEGPLLPRLATLKEALGDSLLDFSGKTTPGLAMALVATASLIVSEDSGLMHLAWVQGVPAIAIFGATRAVWSRPDGPGCTGFYSEDLSCGACMQPVCARGDLLCLTRVGVTDVFDRARAVLERSDGG